MGGPSNMFGEGAPMSAPCGGGPCPPGPGGGIIMEGGPPGPPGGIPNGGGMPGGGWCEASGGVLAITCEQIWNRSIEWISRGGYTRFSLLFYLVIQSSAYLVKFPG